MWTCLKCGEQVEDDFEICWSCSTSRDGVEDAPHDPAAEGIVSQRDFEIQRQARLDEKLVQVAAFPTPQDAHFLKNLIEQEGIPACVADEEAVLTNWLLQAAMGGIKVLVLENDVPRATEIAAHFAKESSSQVSDEPDTNIKDDYGLSRADRQRRDDRFWRRTDGSGERGT